MSISIKTAMNVNERSHKEAGSHEHAEKKGSEAETN